MPRQTHPRSPEDRINARLTPEDRRNLSLIADALDQRAGGRRPTLTEALRVALKVAAGTLLAVPVGVLGA